MAAGGMASVEEFENRFSKYTRQIRLSSGLWARYMRGEVMPQGSLAGNKSSLVARLDVEYPGTATIFYHPLWELLDFDRLLGPAQLKRHYMVMGKDVWKHFVASSASATTSDIEQLRFWKASCSEGDLMRRWGGIGGLDGLAACLIEARLGYLGQVEADFARGILGTRGRFAKLRDMEVFAPKRMQSALLVLERMCIRYAQYLIAEGPLTSRNAGHLTVLGHWREGWQARSHEHSESLPTTFAKTYLDWGKQVHNHQYTW